MPIWTNQDLVVYHGTDSGSVPAGTVTGATFPFAVSLGMCRPRTDFGQGFYTTTNAHQAEQWANTRVLRLPARPLVKAVVLSFRLDRNWLASLDSLTFVRPTTDFWALVADSRSGFSPHGRFGPGSTPPYDVVHGPVTLWPQRLMIADCDQISFHTSGAVSRLGSATLYAQASTHTF